MKHRSSDAMLAALTRDRPEDVAWNTPAGGMFLWARLPADMSAVDLLPKEVAFVPGAAFHAGNGDPRTLRLSFVTASVAQIYIGIATLAAAIREMRKSAHPAMSHNESHDHETANLQTS